MKAAKMLSGLHISGQDLKQIKEAVKNAEQNTSGEIALAVTGESQDYAFYELFVSILAGFLVFLALLFFHAPMYAFIGRLLWHTESWYITGFCGFISFAAIAAIYLLTNIPSLDRIIIPGKARRQAVYRRALRHFVESGVYATRDHNGILIFISLMEHEVCILADSGILQKIARNDLDTLARDLAAGIKKRELLPSLKGCIAACGTLLETHFPGRKDDSNELPDGLIILE